MPHDDDLDIEIELYDLSSWVLLGRKSFYCPIQDMTCIHDAFLIIVEDMLSDYILAEEEGSKKLDSDYTWILDPIDGTRSFIIGRPLWGTLICLVYKDLPIIGLADFPALNERWLGYRNNCFFQRLGH